MATKSEVPWNTPCKILFKDAKTLLITDMGAWEAWKGKVRTIPVLPAKNAGKVWSLNIETMEVKMVYSGGRETHGLAIDNQSRILIDNSNKIVRINNLEDQNPKEIIGNLPIRGKHPLSHFILLPNNDLVLNISAPSDHCGTMLDKRFDPNPDPNRNPEAYKNPKLQKGECTERDREAELRLYKYNENGTYDPNYKIIAMGLRNSMALLYNSKNNNLYQAENSIDIQGTNFVGPTKSEKNKEFIDSLDKSALQELDTIYKKFHAKKECNTCHSKTFGSPDSKATLHLLMNKNWVTPEIDAQQMPFIERMDPSQIGKPTSMPLDSPYGETHNANFEALRKWLQDNISNK